MLSIYLYQMNNQKFNLEPTIEDQIDIFVIPGIGGPRDGLKPIQSLPEWVTKKLDLFLDYYHQSTKSNLPVIVLSAGTIHRSGELDINGRNFNECTAMGLYLKSHGFDTDLIYEENTSYDTIGNAFFLRSIHSDIRKWFKMMVVVNQFHYLRLKTIFDWVFALSNNGVKSQYQLFYLILPDNQVSQIEIIQARINREKLCLEQIQQTISKLNITNLSELHRWLFSEHRAYAFKFKSELVLNYRTSELDRNCLASY